jgi:hypothetical protein
LLQLPSIGFSCESFTLDQIKSEDSHSVS